MNKTNFGSLSIIQSWIIAHIEMVGSASPPYCNEEFKHQTALSSISDEEFSRLIETPKFTTKQRIFQVVCFFVFLGPIRILLAAVTFISGCSIINVIKFCQRRVGYESRFMKRLCLAIAQFSFFFINLGLGIVWYRTKGKMDKKARIVICNHTALIDPFITLVTTPITPVIKKEVSKIGFLTHVLENVDPIFVRRDIACGQTKMIIDRANDPVLFPVLIYPEGTISGGDYILKFRHGAFITDYTIQPIAMRYVMPFVPKGWNYYTWKKASIWQHLWSMVSMPPSFVEITYLDPISKPVEGEGDVEKLAVYAQLKISNYLGLKATDRTTHQLYEHRAQLKKLADSCAE